MLSFLPSSQSSELMLSQSLFNFSLTECLSLYYSSSKRPQKVRWRESLCTKHSEGALFLAVDLCNPPVTTHVTFAS